MWYVVQVKTGTEESVRKQYMRLYEEGLREGLLQRLQGGLQQVAQQTSRETCFIPYYEQMKRYQGAWHKERRILFPGYVFIVSDDLEQLERRLRQVIGLTKLLGIEHTAIPLTEEEVLFLTRFGGDDHVVVMSKGIMENTQVFITEGPLQGWEGLIKRIDRHKRKAWLEVQMFGRKQQVEVGLEILEKRCREE